MQGKKPHRNGSVHGIRLGLKLLCLLLCVGFFCGAAAESPSAESEPASPSEDELVAWAKILDYLEVDKWVNYEGVITGDPWFVTCRLPGNVYAICEMLHEQQVFSFLIPGEERALLLDTGLGMLDIREVVDSLTDLPVTVLNSHDHFDHIGGNARFEEVWCYNDPAAIAHLTAGPSETELQEVKNPTKYIRIIMDYMDIRVPDIIPGKAPTGTVEDGQIIDLGGRKLEVIHTPGHQPSCIMLLDRENHLLFTGDMFYPGPMYCMFVDSSLGDYVQSIRKALAIAEENGVEQVYPSHNLPTADLEDLRRFSAFLEQVEAGEISEYEIEDGYPTYYMDDVYSISLAGEGQEPMSGFSGPASDSASNIRAGRRLANRPSLPLRPSSAISGRSAPGRLSHLGPPTAPSSTASLALQISTVSSGRHCPA